jgi:prophage antirepressor-like protein
MTELTIFKNEQFGEVRTLMLNGEPYFCLADVCKILELENISQVKSRLNNPGIISNEVGVQTGVKKDGSPAMQYVKANFVNEPNLYRCIFQSKKEFAVKFQDWIFEEVIPKLRKTGMYVLAPKSYAETLRALANEVEEKELIKKQRDEAILTKAWISDKKTATAMNTASQKVKEVNRLKMELEKSKEFASVKAVEKLTKQKFDWRNIRNYCTANELEMGTAFDANYTSVRTYPAEAWKAVYQIDLKELFS